MIENETFSIEIEGQEIDDLYRDLKQVEIELDDELAGMFRIQFVTGQKSDGLWWHLDDTRLQIWKGVTIRAGFGDDMEEIISGYITHVKPLFESDAAESTLEIWGMDRSVLMDREEKLKDWPNKTDSDIATEIFGLYGLTPTVEVTDIVHDEAISTIIQRETDIQFLKRLALRNGFECYIAGTTGYFRPPQIDTAPQPLLAVHFGEETNVTQFSLEVNALDAANIEMLQVDRANKDVLEAVAVSSQQTALGQNDAEALLGSGMNPGQFFIGKNSATGNPEMTALCQGLYHEAAWFVSGEGIISGGQYGHLLKPRATVTIKGIGETHSGIYYVTQVTHQITAEGLTQSFKVKRNGLMPTGAENFESASSGLLDGLL